MSSMHEYIDEIIEGNNRRIEEAREEGYQRGASDMEAAKQIIIDSLLKRLDELEHGVVDGLIGISVEDLPITVAEKLITTKRKLKDGTIPSVINKSFGGNGETDAFSCDELLEIAEHLITHCKHNGEE